MAIVVRPRGATRPWPPEGKVLRYNELMELPRSVRNLLWEYDVEAVQHRRKLEQMVFERVMARGSWEDMCWLLRTYGRDRLRAFLEQKGWRKLPPRELRFWSWACGAPDEVIRTWVDRARERERAWRG